MEHYSLSLQEIIDTVGEWHDTEGINPANNRVIAIFCAFADLYYNGLHETEAGRDINALRVALEAAFQLGRANGREQDV